MSKIYIYIWDWQQRQRANEYLWPFGLITDPKNIDFVTGLEMISGIRSSILVSDIFGCRVGSSKPGGFLVAKTKNRLLKYMTNVFGEYIGITFLLIYLL